MAEEDIEQAFVAAAEIVKKVPRHLQEIAFNRALDHLLSRQDSNTPGTKPTTRRGGAGSPRRSTSSDRRADADLLNSIDRTRYPDVGSTSRIADRALKILQLANDDFGVDGLTAAELAEILSQKFRLTVRANSIIKALERETDTVNIRQSDRGRTFHLMAPGEEYLNRLRAATTDGPQPKAMPTKKPGKGSRPSAARDDKKVSKPEAKAEKTFGRKQSGRPGPKAAISQLVTRGFFNSPRTISQIQEELKHKRGHTYTVQELSPALVRSLRDHTLTRERSASGQYEYTAA